MAIEFDPIDPDYIADPYPMLRELQDQDPVHFSAALKGWVVTRYEDVRDGLRDPRLSVERVQSFLRQLPAAKRAGIADLARSLSLWAVFLDPPAHSRLRRLLAPAVATQVFERLRPRVHEIVEDLLAPLEVGTRFDLMAELAYPLPATVIAEFLGLPAEDIDRFKAWSDELATFLGRSSAGGDGLDRAQAAAARLDRYFRDIIADRRAAPRDDFVSRLIAAEERGDILDEDELSATCALLLFAGNETTTNLIGNAVYALIRNPAQAALLRQRPELMASGVEEFLRFDGPGGAAGRVVKEDFTLRGRRLERGDHVHLMIHAANRDPREFAAPDRLDVTRRHNPHLAFGHGIHLCLGAQLARMETRIALAALLDRFADLSVADVTSPSSRISAQSASVSGQVVAHKGKIRPPSSHRPAN